MSTEAQVAWLVEPFLARHPEFVRVGRTLERRPMGHLSVGFDICRTAYKGHISPIWGAGITFGPPPHFGGGIGRTLDRAVGFVDAPDLQDRLLDALELANETILQRFTSLEALVELEMAVHPSFEMIRFLKAVLLAGVGRLEAADNLLAADIEYRIREGERFDPLYARLRTGSKAWHHRQEEVKKRGLFIGHLKYLHGFIERRDLVGLAALLHDWEAQGVAARKMADHWQPSPFPFELGRG